MRKSIYFEDIWTVLQIRCLYIEGGKISGLPDDTPIERLEGDEIMVCDLDAIYRGKFNFKIYGQIGKFLEPVVVNFPNRVEDLMDSLISGATKVVLHSTENTVSLDKMLQLSDDIVLPARNPNSSLFIERGGKYLISDHEVFSRFDTCYNVGLPLTSEKYINVHNFPENLLQYI